EVARLERRVVDRLAVDDEQRLTVALNGLEATDDDRGTRAGVAGLRGDLHAGGLRRERVDDVRLVGFLDLLGFDRVDRVPKLLDRRGRTRADDDDFAESERVGGEREVLR